jgi:hypothetical protein
MDGKGEEVFEYLLVVLIVGIVANVLGNFVTPYLDFFTSTAIILLATVLFIVLKMDLHKNLKGGKQKMKKIGTILLCVLLTLGLSLVVASVLYELTVKQQATIAEVSFTAYVDEQEWNQVDTLNWGDSVEPGATYFANLTVQNTGLENVTAYLITNSLPSGWTESWTANATFLEPGQSAMGDWDLTVDINATQGQTYTWNSTISVVPG